MPARTTRRRRRTILPRCKVQMGARGTLSQGARVLRRAVEVQNAHKRKSRRSVRRTKELRDAISELRLSQATLEPPHKAAVVALGKALRKFTDWEASRAQLLQRLIAEVSGAVTCLEDAAALIRSESVAAQNEALHKARGQAHGGSASSQRAEQRCGVRWMTESDLSLPLLCSPLQVPPRTKR